jgi:DNA-binding HxlR family transcriptional regulator
MPPEIRMTGPLDPRSGWKAERCTVARALGVLSTRTAFLIMREAFYGTTRFEEFVERVGVSEPVAAARLRELLDEGLLSREPYREPGQRTRQRYVLTDKGADLVPVLVALMQWGDRWLDERGGPVRIRHAGCGERVAAELRCAAGHPVGADELELEPAPHRRRELTEPQRP